jgi:putative aldouronate transport system permease protein
MINIRRDFTRNKMTYVLMLPIAAYFIIFCYGPMAGVVMAFQEFSPRGGLFNSPWVGLKHFRDFFSSVYFLRVLRNTVLISFFDLVWGFPVPIIFALLLNEVKNKAFKKTIQTISYLPYFISMVIICGLVADFTTSNGVITNLVVSLGGERQNLLGQARLFRSIYVGSNIWQSLGFGSIIYLAALSSVDQELYEAAIIDGAGRLRQTWYITLPCIASTIIILLIIRMGTLLYVGSEKILLLYSPVTYETADVISTFVYRKGLQEFNYGYSTAVNLFNSVINTAFLLITNKISRKYSEISLF